VRRLKQLLQAGLAVQQSRTEEHHQAMAETIVHERPGLNDIMSWATAEAFRRQAGNTKIDIEHALCRIDDGSYGSCELCGRPIPFARLEAIPEARTCLSCHASGSAQSVTTRRAGR
jgi:RNA polymerase-binding transcription factor DksA